LSNLLKYDRVLLGEPLEIEDAENLNITHENEAENNGTDNCSTEKNDVYNELISRAELKEKAIVEKAKKEAEKIIEESVKEAEKVNKAAYSKGYEDGHEKGYMEGMKSGRQEGLESVASYQEEALQSKKKAIEMKDRAIRDAEERIVDLVLQISRKVIGEQVQINQEAVLSIVKKAIDKCPFSRKVKMRIAPEDYDIVLSNKDKLYCELECISDLEVIMETGLNPGSCILETDAGFVDSSIEAQISRIEKSFRELLNYEQY